MSNNLRLGLVGFGKIARDEHVPAIASTPGVELVAVATPEGASLDVPVYDTLKSMLAGSPQIEAVVMCQPPRARFVAAREAIMAGRHVLLEKPPGATLGEVKVLCKLAGANRVSLFAAWHSRWSPQVTALREWCAARSITAVRIAWKEDVRAWHPGQDWIRQPGGFGVFDPGINALSILTSVIPGPMRVVGADLDMPSNWSCPIAASLVLETAQRASVVAEFDWRQTGDQVWRIEFEAMDERFVFEQGAGAPHQAESGSPLAVEYRAMYAHFASLVRKQEVDVDVEPLRIVGDSFLCGTTRIRESFDI